MRVDPSGTHLDLGKQEGCHGPTGLHHEREVGPVVDVVHKVVAGEVGHAWAKGLSLVMSATRIRRRTYLPVAPAGPAASGPAGPVEHSLTVGWGGVRGALRKGVVAADRASPSPAPCTPG